jgi:DNA repair photolyase
MRRPPHDLPPVDPALRAPARATPARLAGRYETLVREWAHDGWDIPEDTRLVQREVTIERPRSVISRNASPDLDFDRALNPYRGCEHGCIFCYARPSHAWLGLSPGLDFETRLIARPDAPQVLARELGARGYQVAPLALGSNTDPWQPVEAERGITRAVLEVLRDWRHPVTITTRSALILRDLDLLSDMAAQGLVQVSVSLPSLDAAFLRASEPRAPRPETRLRVMAELAAAGVPVRLMLAPVIPGLSDDQVERVIAAAAQAGAQAVWHSILRLPHEVAPLFWDWLARVYPNRVARVRRALGEMRDGAENDSRFGTRFDGQGPMAALLARRVGIAARRAGLARDLPKLRCDLFRRPPRPGDQLDLF